MVYRTMNSGMRRSALSIALAVCLAGGASAQTTTPPREGESLGRIEVTGSRIRQVDSETAQPVLVISRQALEAQGVVSVADVLQTMSLAGSPPISRSDALSSGESVGGQYIDLRNLGANRTLVLVDGKRLPITTDGLQDISAVPNIMVERIEILKDGASSTYGSDAIAGVVNIITRRNYNGAEIEAYYGQQSKGDGTKARVAGVMGVSGEKGYITVGAEYRKEGEVEAKNRSFSAVGYPGYPNLGLTAVGQWGNYRVGSSGPWYAANRNGNALGAANFHPQSVEDQSNPNEQMYLVTPLESRTLYINGEWRFSDKLRWKNEIGYSKREMTQQIAGYPLQSTAISAPMAANSYFNPVGTSAVNWRRRGWEVPRVTRSDVTSLRFVTSLDGTFNFGSRYMDWEAGYSYADAQVNKTGVGDFNKVNVRAAVGPSFMNAQGVVQCGTAANPIPLNQCVPWNPYAGFGTGAVANSLADPAVQKFLFPELHYSGKTSTRMAFANISGNIVTLPAGDLSYAFGYESREEKGGYYPDALAQSGISSTLAAGSTSGSYHVTEYFGELQIPVIAEKPFARELSFNIASRYSKYNTFGSTTNSKVSLKWKPVDDLMVRATWAQGFRAPTISDLYSGGSETFETYADPCDSLYGDARASARCLAAVGAGYRQLKQGFVPSDGKAVQSPVPFVSGANPLLQPEKSKSWTAGLVYSPAYLKGFNVALDWWKIRINDTMVSDSPDEILKDCYIGGIDSRCGMFTRDPSTHIVSTMTFGLRNAGYSLVEGYDLSIGYRYRTQDWGQFSINSDSSIFKKYETKSTNDVTAPVVQNVGFASSSGSYFRTRSNLALGWDYHVVGLTWTARYYSSMKEDCYFDERCNLPNYASPGTRGEIVPQNRNPGTLFHDVQLRVRTPIKGTVSIGVNNVFDKLGPVMYSKPSSSFAYYGGFDIGRYWYFKYSQKF